MIDDHVNRAAMKRRPVFAGRMHTYFPMRNTLSVAKSQANFARLLKEAEAGPVSITSDGETVAFTLGDVD